MVNAEASPARHASQGPVAAPVHDWPVHDLNAVKGLLPRLRRHALVLTGDAGQADRSLAECLTALRRRPGAVRGSTLRLDLFRLYHATVRDSLPAPPVDPATSPFGGLATEAREVVSLVAVERFSVAEAAEVLGLSRHRVAGLLVQARRHLTAA